MSLFVNSLKSYAKRADGSMTLLGLYLGVAMLIIGSMALDVSNLIAVRTQLQAAADFAAHAALYERTTNKLSADQAKAEALKLVEKSFPKKKFGPILKASDIHFGSYDRATGGFKVDEDSSAAAVAFSARTRDNGNWVAGFLSKLFGYSTWDVRSAAVFETFRPGCLRDGWVGQDTVDAQSNNTFKTGFCIHSNTDIEFNSGSMFEGGVTVSSPQGFDTTIVPTSGYDSNIGLKESVVPNYYNLAILNHMADIFDNIQNVNSEYCQDYLSGTALPLGCVDFSVAVPGTVAQPTLPASVELTTLNSTTADFTPYVVNTATCNGNQQLFIDATPTLKNVAIYTNCKVTFRQDSSLENVVLYTTSTNDKSITAPNGLRLGVDDGCAPGGGVKMMTEGGFEVAQELQIYGSQVLAQGPIQFAAAADGVEGGSFISGQTVDGTSNTTMGVCGNDNGEVFQWDLITMAG